MRSDAKQATAFGFNLISRSGTFEASWKFFAWLAMARECSMDENNPPVFRTLMAEYATQLEERVRMFLENGPKVPTRVNRMNPRLRRQRPRR